MKKRIEDAFMPRRNNTPKAMPHAVINDARLWYERRGQGDEVIFLHHGYTACRDNWMPVAERLEDRFSIVLMECRGAGESEHTESGYNFAQYAADVVALLDHLDLEKVTFAGHSMGGGIGYVLGLEYPERLQKLVLMAPIPSGGTGPITPELREERLRERREKNADAILERYRMMRFREDVETDEWFNSRVKNVLGVSDQHFEHSAEAMQDFDVTTRLPKLTVPTLMIAGAVDNLLHANLQDFAALPEATLEVLSRAGHEVAVHEPDRVADAIASFVAHGAVTAETLLKRVVS